MKLQTLCTLPLAAFVASSAVSYHDGASLSLEKRSTAINTTNVTGGVVCSSNSSNPNFTTQQLWDMNKQFLYNFTSPYNAIQAQSINSTLFADNVQGRVDITRTFFGRELNTEYIFGLFANLAANSASNSPASFSLLGYPVGFTILQWAGSQNVVSCTTRFNFLFPFLKSIGAPNGGVVPLVINTFNAFDSDGKISMYDATFKWWDWAFNTTVTAAGALLGAGGGGFYNASVTGGKPLSDAETLGFVQQNLVTSICYTATQYCNGTNTQYNSTTQCHTYLATKIRLGLPYELGRNTLLCRMVHQNMVQFRPDVHCGHIGPTGGGYCNDDMNYTSTVLDQPFTNYPFAGA